jgi:hypothetical protein
MYLICVSIWAEYNYLQDEHDTDVKMHAEMKPTYTYFDTNRAAEPIIDMKIEKVTAGTTTACTGTPGGGGVYKRLNIYDFDGNVAGYKLSSKYYTGTAATTATGATSVSAHSARKNYVFNQLQFCAATMKMSHVQAMDTSTQSTPCTPPQKACSECYCSKVAVTNMVDKANVFKQLNVITATTGTTPTKQMCPYDTYHVGKVKPETNKVFSCQLTNAAVDKNVAGSYTTVTPVGGTANAANDGVWATCTWGGVRDNSWLLDVRAELFGPPCMNQKMHGAATNKNGFTNLFTDSYTGCDKIFG